jgi:proteic killer suppression protein
MMYSIEYIAFSKFFLSISAAFILISVLSGYNVLRYITRYVIAWLKFREVTVIVGFACADTRTIWNGNRARRFPSDIQDVALRKLRMLNAARKLSDLKVPPGNRLEALKGNRKGQYSIRINDQWRICFRWDEGQGGPSHVEIIDYH